jgi:hypothetical protein
VYIYIKYILYKFKIKCLILSSNHIDASASTRINIFEHVAIRTRSLTVSEDSQQRGIRNAWRPTSIKVGLNISHTLRSNVVTTRFLLIISRPRVILIRIFEKILCARAIPEI